MSLILPAMNTLWFCFPDEKNRRLLHGTPEDCMRKFKVLENMGVLDQGLEIFLSPTKLQRVNEFDSWFYEKFSKLKYKTVHIGDGQHDFLLNFHGIYDKLKLLSKMLERLEVTAIIIHAHHLRYYRSQIKDLFSSAMHKTEIYVENNSFENEWGHSIEGLLEIFKDCPEYWLCLDIAHIKDLKKFTLKEFLSHDDLRDRIRQIHFSYSTRYDNENLYAKLGYPGYEPLHALWSVIGASPSTETIEFVCQYPVVLEGVVPPEEMHSDLLMRELRILR